MTKSEMRKYLKGLTKDQLEAVLLELFSRQDRLQKEVFELTLTGIVEDRPLPDRKAVIPDVSKDRKKLALIQQRSFSWYYYGRRRARSTAKKDLRQMVRTLLLCPEKSQAYPEACSLLEDCFVLCCAIETSHLMGQETVYSLIHMETDNFFRTVAGFILKSGYTRENLKRLSSLSCITDSHDWVLSLRLQEILVAMMKNGDLRIEMLDLLEERIQAGLAARHPGLLMQRLIFLYLRFCEKETSLDSGLSWLSIHAGKKEVEQIETSYLRLCQENLNAADKKEDR